MQSVVSKCSLTGGYRFQRYGRRGVFVGRCCSVATHPDKSPCRCDCAHEVLQRHFTMLEHSLPPTATVYTMVAAMNVRT
jgi:hypothetical protein